MIKAVGKSRVHCISENNRNMSHAAGRDTVPSSDAEEGTMETKGIARIDTHVVDPGMDSGTPAAW